MADLIPNDLSHLSDDEFNALCPHDGHAPGPEPLSPVAQAVLDAYGHHAGGIGCILDYELRGVAAALRAAADQVIEEVFPIEAILTIATELENHQ